MHTNLYFWISFAIYSEQLAVFKIDITGSVLTKSYWFYLCEYWYNWWWCQVELITSSSSVLLSPWKLKLQNSLINPANPETEDNKD